MVRSTSYNAMMLESVAWPGSESERRSRPTSESLCIMTYSALGHGRRLIVPEVLIREACKPSGPPSDSRSQA